MDADHLTALRQAATALISTAGAPTVLAALQALLADPAFAAEAAAIPLRMPQPAPESTLRQAPGLPTPGPAKAQRAGTRSAAAPVNPEWDQLRHAVRRAMTERGADFAAIGRAIGRSGTAVRIDLTSRRAARPAIQTKLKEWLANGVVDAPEVAAAGPMFRGNGTGAVHAGNGAATG